MSRRSHIPPYVRARSRIREAFEEVIAKCALIMLDRDEPRAIQAERGHYGQA